MAACRLPNVDQANDLRLNGGAVVGLGGRVGVFFVHALKVSPPPANPGQMNGVKHLSLDSMVDRRHPSDGLGQALWLLLAQSKGRRMTVQQAVFFVMVATASPEAPMTISGARSAGLGQAITRSHSTLLDAELIEPAGMGSHDGRESPFVLTPKGREVWNAMMSAFGA